MHLLDRDQVMGDGRETIASGSASTMLIPFHPGAMGDDHETIASGRVPTTLILVQAGRVVRV